MTPGVLEVLLDHGAEINAADREGQTALMLAARRGDLDMVTGLVGRGADVNSASVKGLTALSVAAEQNHRRIVEFLRKHGATYDIHSAAAVGDTEKLERHASAGGEIDAREKIYGRSLLWMAAHNGHTAVVGWLVDRKADMEAQGPNGETPLHAAATSGQNDVVALLLDNGANIQAWSEGMGGTALHLACLYGHLETVKLLLNRGCHIETRTKAQGETPLMVASESGATGAVQLLLKRGADLNAVDRKGRTPLMKASGRLEVDTVRALLDAGADVSRKDTEYQCTALHDVCCTEGCPEDAVKIADLLIQKGAQADQPDGDGISSLDCAAGNGCEQLTALLINAGNNVRVSRTRLEKALIHCASDGHFNEKVATLLLQKGASVNCKDAEGYSPLMHAKELGDADAVRFLIENGADTKVPQ